MIYERCETGALRLRTAQHPVGVEDAGSDQTGQFQGLGEHDRHAGPARHEPLETGRRGRAAVHVAHRRPVPDDGAGEDHLRRPGTGHPRTGITTPNSLEKTNFFNQFSS